MKAKTRIEQTRESYRIINHEKNNHDQIQTGCPHRLIESSEYAMDIGKLRGTAPLSIASRHTATLYVRIP